MVFMIWDETADRCLDDGWGRPLVFTLSAAAEEFIRRTGRADLEVRLVDRPPPTTPTSLPPPAPRH
jgi:hypothetical protein